MNLKQSRLGSLAESLASTAAGFGLSLLCQWLFFAQWLGLPLSIELNLLFAVIMTVVSIARQFVLRRVFEYFRVSRTLSPGMLAVIAERYRQIDAKGYTAAHDDGYRPGVMARAGAAYALGDHVESVEIKVGDTLVGRFAIAPTQFYPWPDGMKVRDFRDRMAVAGALIVAEIDRHDRLKRVGDWDHPRPPRTGSGVTS